MSASYSVLIRQLGILLRLYDPSTPRASMAVQVFKTTRCCIFKYGLFVRIIDRSWTHGSNAPFFLKYQTFASFVPKNR